MIREKELHPPAGIPVLVILVPVMLGAVALLVAAIRTLQSPGSAGTGDPSTTTRTMRPSATTMDASVAGGSRTSKACRMTMRLDMAAILLRALPPVKAGFLTTDPTGTGRVKSN